VPFEAALNLLWVSLALGAFALLGWAEVCSSPLTARRTRSKRLLAVVFAILFLFPCISESDDLLSLQNFQFTPETRGQVGAPSPQNPSDEQPDHLVRFFTSLQTFQIAALYAVLSVLLYVALVFATRANVFERYLAAACGRGPPACLPN
jgi:ABC-type phosphate/phosphonate transport system permease subunit